MAIEPLNQAKKEYFLIDKWTTKNSKLIAGFTTKLNGFSKPPYDQFNMGFHVGDYEHHVQKNRIHLANLLSIPVDRFVSSEQTHGKEIACVQEEHAGLGSLHYKSSISNTDGLYTNNDHLLLTLCYADCTPLFFYAEKNHMIGIAHAGWKGTVLEIASKMVREWQDKGVSIDDIEVVIGPSICGNCYVVDDRVINEVKKLVEKPHKNPYNLINEGHYELDLKELNRQILINCGINPTKIDVSSFCTHCDDELFFSHRRDRGTTGRMMSFIGWKE
jgi:YfiH family protein